MGIVVFDWEEVYLLPQERAAGAYYKIRLKGYSGTPCFEIVRCVGLERKVQIVDSSKRETGPTERLSWPIWEREDSRRWFDRLCKGLR